MSGMIGCHTVCLPPLPDIDEMEICTEIEYCIRGYSAASFK